MIQFKLSCNDLSLRVITIIQLAVATIISLIFQYLIPYSWQLLDTFLYGAKQHGDIGANIVIFNVNGIFHFQ